MKKTNLLKLFSLTLVLMVSMCFAFACDETHEHSYTEIVTEPTCTEKGYTTYECSCGDTYTDNEVDALGHNFETYVSDNNATYDTDGTKTAKCTRCDEKDTVTNNGTKLPRYLRFKTLNVGDDEENVLPGSQVEFDFSEEIETFGVEYIVAHSTNGPLVEDLVIDVEVTSVKYYVYEIVNGQESNRYTINIRRNNIFAVEFNTGCDDVIEAQYVEQDKFAIEPTTVIEKAGYTLNGWKFNGQAFDFETPITQNITLEADWTANDNTPYKVEYYLQDIANEVYVLSEIEDKEGTTDTLAEVTPKSIEGYTFNENYAENILSGNIAGEGSLVLKLYYYRNVYEVAFETGCDAEVDTQIIEQGDCAVIPTEPVRAGYTFNGWKFNGQAFDFETPITQNITLEADWTANDNTPYKVEYYLQDLEGSGYTLSETKDEVGTTDTLASIVAKSIEGFIFNENHQDNLLSGNIAGDGSLVLKLYYDRIICNVELSMNNEQAGTVTGAGSYRYGATVTIIANSNSGYNFEGWFIKGTDDLFSADANYTFTASTSGEYEARWTSNAPADYTIEYYFENLDGVYIINDDLTEIKSAPFGATVSVEPGLINHFEFNEGYIGNVLEGVVLEDGSLVLKLYYNRCVYDVTVSKDINEAGTVTGGGSYKYGTEITITATTNNGYTFIGWYVAGTFTKVADDASYTFVVSEDVEYQARWETLNGVDVDGEIWDTEE